MKTILTDFDGVVFDSEFPRALGWYIAARIADEKIESKILDKIRYKIISNQELEKLVEADKRLFESIRRLAGKSTEETLDGVWELSDKKRTKQYLSSVRNELKTPLLVSSSKPIQESIDFFKELRQNDIKVGLVTQTDSKMLREFQESSKVSLDDIFDPIECCGDDFYNGMRKSGRHGINKKSVGYAIACKTLDVNPRETLCFEDSDSGIQAANNIGLTAVGYKRKGNRQRLYGAALVVSDLERFSNLRSIHFIRDNLLEKVIEFMHRRSKESGKWVRMRMDADKKTSASPVKNTDIKSIEYLRNLDYVLESWDADPEKENAVAEDYTIKCKAGESFRDVQLAIIAENIAENEVPLGFRVSGGRMKNPCSVYMKVRVDGEEKEIELYHKTEFCSSPPLITGRMKDVSGWW